MFNECRHSPTFKMPIEEEDQEDMEMSLNLNSPPKIEWKFGETLNINYFTMQRKSEDEGCTSSIFG